MASTEVTYIGMTSIGVSIGMTSTEVTIIGMTSIGVSSGMTSTGAISIGAKSIAASQLRMIMVWVDLAGVWGPCGGHGSVCVCGGVSLLCVSIYLCVCMCLYVCTKYQTMYVGDAL